MTKNHHFQSVGIPREWQKIITSSQLVSPVSNEKSSLHHSQLEPPCQWRKIITSSQLEPPVSDRWRMTKQVRSNPSWVPEAQSKTLRTPQNVPAPTVCWPEGGTGPSVLQNLPFGPFFSSKIYTLHHHWLTHKSEEKKRKQVARRWLWGEVVMTPNEQALAGSGIF